MSIPLKRKAPKTPQTAANKKHATTNTSYFLNESKHNDFFVIKNQESIDLIEQWSSFKNHADNPLPDQSNRIQNLLILQSKEVDEKSTVTNNERRVDKAHISRSTALIPGSYLVPELFQTYYLTYIDGKKDVSGCPAQMPELRLNEFNVRLAHLKASDTNAEPWLHRLMQYEKVAKNPEAYLGNLPSSYYYVIPQYSSGDLLLFMPGTIHSVIGSTANDMLRIKISTELCSSTTRELEISSGSYKKAAREFEFSHMDRVTNMNKSISDIVISPHLLVRDALRLSDLTLHGIALIRAVIGKECASALFKHSASYLSNIMGVPLDLTNPHSGSILHNKKLRDLTGIEDAMIRRQPGNSRSTIVPKDHGISGIGFGCVALKQLYQEALKPFFSAIYQSHFGNPTHEIKDICIHLQAPS